MMAQDTEGHAFLVMTTITGSSVAKVACGDRSTILDTRVPNNAACSTYPTGYPYGFKYVGVGAYRNTNGLVYIVQYFAGCNSACGSLPIPLGQGSIFPNQMRTGEVLKRGEQIRSGNGYRMVLQATDGNLVILSPSNKAVWASGTNGKGADNVTFGDGGNLVIFTASNKAKLWESKIAGNGGGHLALTNDGNLAIYNANLVALWSSKTGLIAPPSTSPKPPPNAYIGPKPAFSGRLTLNDINYFNAEWPKWNTVGWCIISHESVTAGMYSTGNGDGAFQIIKSTWGGFYGFSNASSAPADVQWVKFFRLYADGAGGGHWHGTYWMNNINHFINAQGVDLGHPASPPAGSIRCPHT